MEVASVSLLVVNKLPALQALALDYAEDEEDFVSFLNESESDNVSNIVLGLCRGGRRFCKFFNNSESDDGKMFQILSSDYAEEEEKFVSFQMIVK